MNLGESIDRLVEYRLNPGDASSFKEFDKVACANLEVYWAMFGPYGHKPDRTSIEYLFIEVDKRLAKKGVLL